MSDPTRAVTRPDPQSAMTRDAGTTTPGPGTETTPQRGDAETPADAPELTVRRVVAATRARVFAAFANPREVDRWFGPEGFGNTTHAHDFRPGGVWRHTMHGPDGTDYANRSVFVTVEPPALVVWDQGWDRDPFEPLHRTSITLAERGDRTEVALRLVFPTVAARDAAARDHGAVAGARDTLERLAAHVEANA